MNTSTLTYGPHLSEAIEAQRPDFDWDDAVTTIVIDPPPAVEVDEDSIDGVELIDGTPSGEIVTEAAPAKPKRIRKPVTAKVVTEMAKEAVTKPVKAPKAKAAAPKAEKPVKAKAPKVAEVVAPKLADLPEGRERNHERHGRFAGQHDFGRVRLTKSASSAKMWGELLATGETRITLAAEVRNIRKAAAREMNSAQLEGAARNRIGQTLTQPYQAWYANNGKGSGIFRSHIEGVGAHRVLVISYADNKRPPLLISPDSQRPTMVGKIAAAMYEPGMRFACGVKVADVKAVLAKLDDK